MTGQLIPALRHTGVETNHSEERTGELLVAISHSACLTIRYYRRFRLRSSLLALRGRGTVEVRSKTLREAMEISVVFGVNTADYVTVFHHVLVAVSHHLYLIWNLLAVLYGDEA